MMTAQAQFSLVELPQELLTINPEVPSERLYLHLRLAGLQMVGPPVVQSAALKAMLERHVVADPNRAAQLTEVAGRETWRALEYAAVAARLMHLLPIRATWDAREVLAGGAVALAWLTEVERLGADVTSLRRTLTEHLRSLWKANGSPTVQWLFATRGPRGEEQERWEAQLQALDHRPEQKTPSDETPDPLAHNAEPCPAGDVSEHPDLAVLDEEPDIPVRRTLTATTSSEQTVLDALRGKRLVVVGGDYRPFAAQALTTAFELSTVDWIPARAYDHGLQMDAHLKHPDVVAVVFALRWAAHAHGSIRQRAWALGVPAISLPGGYNPRQVLHQLSIQVSERLASV